MRMVLFVVFWVWLAVSVTVYGYRLWRRVTQGPKSVREARVATDAGRSAALGTEAPSDAPVPDRPDGAPGDRPIDRATDGATDGPAAATRDVFPRASAPTVAVALFGIELPCDLVPIVDLDDATAALGRRVVFTTRSSDVRSVSTALTQELNRLGYETSDAPTDASGNRRRLIATRADATVSVTVLLDDNGTVAAEVST